MPQEQMQELYKELKNAQSTSEYYAPFLEAMKTLDTEMKSLMEPDENGWKLLDPERFRSFSEKYRDAGIKLEQYLGRTANTTDPAERETREKANKLAALMAQDAAVFRHYDPRNPDTQRSLPSLLEESRNPVVDISTAKIQSVGGAQSSRMPMTIIGPNGEALPGVFTKAEIFDPLGSFDRATNLAANSKGVTQQGADLLRNFSTAYKNYYTANPDPTRPVDNNPNMINQLLLQSRGNTDSSTSWTMSTDKIAQQIAKVNGLSVEEVKTACGKKALGDLAGRMKNMAFDTYIKASEIQMEDKTRVDRKNTGMSIVADVLGISHVICHSEAMKIKTADGKIIDGTFMAMAKGVDPNNPGAEARNAGKKSLKNTDGRALEAIADLQVLDYICGNVDRHGGNLFYQFDEETGKLIGVQGIDNDSSLGTRVPQLKNERVRRLPVCHTMGVISKKTADKIMNLTPAELAFALRGTVDEKSIQACANRLRVVQGNIEHSREKLDPNSKEIKYPYLQELTTEEFATADLSKLTDKRVDNHFKKYTIHCPG
ncbi:MAG: hypothetical protein IJM83_06270 [Firmicutes bacterium]|nr:hypothetical protein [Bacillota bacterium]